MFTTLVSVVLLSTVAIQGARADFTIDTPQLFQVFVILETGLL